MKFLLSAFLALSSATALKYELRSDEVDPTLCSGVKPAKSRSGYFNVQGSEYDDKGDKAYFYWMHESQNDPQHAPFVIWLTGGPGCSSTLALLSENGPCAVNEDGTGTVPNPYSWNSNANVLWLDQPAGVGFSYGETNDSNEDMVGEDAYYFVQHFMQTHPEYADAPLYIFGESYGGHYAPAIAHRIFEGNNKLKEGDIPLNLAGVGVGNGLTDPEIQYQYYAEMAFNNSHHIQTVSEKAYDDMVAATPTCIDMIKRCNDKGLLGGLSCTAAYMYCNAKLTSPYYSTGLNPYDIRKECGDNPLCYDFSNVDKWLNSESTLEALHVSSESSSWVSCNNKVNAEFRKDWMLNYDSYIADMLEGDIDVLIYAGDVDFVCNSLGNKAWTLELEWSGKEGFNAVEDQDWEDGSGTVRTYNGLTFLSVADAGHMVPADKPEVALTMLDTFVMGKKLIPGKLSINPNPISPAHPGSCLSDMIKFKEAIGNVKTDFDHILSSCTKSSDECNKALLKLMTTVDDILDIADDATQNCLDGSDSPCNTDIEAVVETLESASEDVTKVIQACPQMDFSECIADLQDVGKVVSEAAKDVLKAIKDCIGE